jgi:predicted RecA/RadA family phage recombinase
VNNFIQPGKTITLTATGAVAAGALVVVGSIVGVAAVAAAASGDDYTVDLAGVFELPKITTDDIGVGDKLYYVSATANLTKTAGTGSKPLVGQAIKAAGNGATTVLCRLEQTLQTGPA